MPTVYKCIFRTVNDELASACGISKYDPYTLFYHTDRYIYPKIGKIFAFGTAINAKKFANKQNASLIGMPVEVWQAHTSGNVRVATTIPAFIPYFESFWDYTLRRTAQLSPTAMMAAPAGTVFCNNLRLIKQM